MREATAVVEELNRIASHLDALGHHAEADQIDALSLRIAADQRKKKRRRRLTPLGKAVMYGIPALLAGQALWPHDSGAAQEALVNPEPTKSVAVPKPPKPNEGDFTKFKQFTLPEEGGFVHRKKSADPGGATNMGVTQFTYNLWRDSIGQPRQSVKKISGDEARKIMLQMYWKPMRAHELPERTAIALADMGYHDGPQDAIKLLQRIVGAPQTGVLGPITMKRVWEVASTAEKDQWLALRLTELREKALKTRPHADANPGWFNRTERVREFVKDPEVFPVPGQKPKKPDAPDTTQGE
jgi:lysozyme family protein